MHDPTRIRKLRKASSVMVRTQLADSDSSVLMEIEQCGTPYSGVTYNLLPWSDSVRFPFVLSSLFLVFIDIPLALVTPSCYYTSRHSLMYCSAAAIRLVHSQRSFMLAFPFYSHPIRLLRCVCSYYCCLCLVIPYSKYVLWLRRQSPRWLYWVSFGGVLSCALYMTWSLLSLNSTCCIIQIPRFAWINIFNSEAGSSDETI